MYFGYASDTEEKYFLKRIIYFLYKIRIIFLKRINLVENKSSRSKFIFSPLNYEFQMKIYSERCNSTYLDVIHASEWKKIENLRYESITLGMNNGRNLKP